MVKTFKILDRTNVSIEKTQKVDYAKGINFRCTLLAKWAKNDTAYEL